jgi:hypothetical protein
MIAQSTVNDAELKVVPLHRNEDDPATRTTIFVLFAEGGTRDGGTIRIPIGVIYPPHQQGAFIESIRDLLPETTEVIEVESENQFTRGFPNDPALNGMVATPAQPDGPPASEPAASSEPLGIPAWMREVFEEPS